MGVGSAHSLGSWAPHTPESQISTAWEPDSLGYLLPTPRDPGSPTTWDPGSPHPGILALHTLGPWALLPLLFLQLLMLLFPFQGSTPLARLLQAIKPRSWPKSPHPWRDHRRALPRRAPIPWIMDIEPNRGDTHPELGITPSLPASTSPHPNSPSPSRIP